MSGLRPLARRALAAALGVGRARRVRGLFAAARDQVVRAGPVGEPRHRGPLGEARPAAADQPRDVAVLAVPRQQGPHGEPDAARARPWRTTRSCCATTRSTAGASTATTREPRRAAARERRRGPVRASYQLCGQCHGDKYRDWRAGRPRASDRAVERREAVPALRPLPRLPRAAVQAAQARAPSRPAEPEDLQVNAHPGQWMRRASPTGGRLLRRAAECTPAAGAARAGLPRRAAAPVDPHEARLAEAERVLQGLDGGGGASRPGGDAAEALVGAAGASRGRDGRRLPSRRSSPASSRAAPPPRRRAAATSSTPRVGRKSFREYGPGRDRRDRARTSRRPRRSDGQARDGRRRGGRCRASSSATRSTSRAASAAGAASTRASRRTTRAATRRSTGSACSRWTRTRGIDFDAREPVLRRGAGAARPGHFYLPVACQQCATPRA